MENDEEKQGEFSCTRFVYPRVLDDEQIYLHLDWIMTTIPGTVLIAADLRCASYRPIYGISFMSEHQYTALRIGIGAES